jgi:hypothetical protein
MQALLMIQLASQVTITAKSALFFRCPLSSLQIISQFLIIDCKELDIVFSSSKQGGSELLMLFLMEDVK